MRACARHSVLPGPLGDNLSLTPFQTSSLSCLPIVSISVSPPLFGHTAPALVSELLQTTAFILLFLQPLLSEEGGFRPTIGWRTLFFYFGYWGIDDLYCIALAGGGGEVGWKSMEMQPRLVNRDDESDGCLAGVPDQILGGRGGP